MRIKYIIIITFILAVEVTGQAMATNGGDPLLGESSEPIEITADNLMVKRLNEIAVFSGDVEAIQGDMNLRSDVMTVYYRNRKNKGKSESAISKIDVDGNVFLTTPDETVQGDKGLYDVDGKRITLSGSVILTQQENVIKGSELIYDLNTGKSQLFSSAKSDIPGKTKGGRVRGLFVPENSK